MSGVLEGVKVVELAIWVAGPSAAGMLADWGADVVKVEGPGGDPMRNVYGAIGLSEYIPNAPFIFNNRGKRSIELDLHTDDGRTAMHRLLASADIFVTNLRPDALERLGLDHTVAMGEHPHLVYCTSTGYGLTGPERDRAGYDVAAFFGRSGFAHQITLAGQGPITSRSAIGDHTTGMASVAGILAALHHKTRTGQGQVVEASLLRTGMWVIGGDLGTQEILGKIRQPDPRTASSTPLVNSYRSSDERWFYLIGVEATRHLPGLMRAIEREDLVDDERFQTAHDLVKYRREMIVILDEAFTSKPMDHWKKVFDTFDVWWAPIQSPAEVLEDPQAEAIGAFIETRDLQGNPVRSVNSPINFHGHEFTRAEAPPDLGQHTDEVLAEIGFSSAEIDAMRGSAIPAPRDV
jgi:crotonobetainyl-CoA:carnitine CoA-transferase CaiB-like acyl-CoA transferase